MLNTEIILGTSETDARLDWVPERISKFMAEIAMIDSNTVMVPPESIIRDDETTLFACSGVQIIYPQLFHGVEVPEFPQLISQPVIRSQHLKYVEEGCSTSFVNYNLINFGLSEQEHIARTKVFFDCMKNADTSKINKFSHVKIVDIPQNWCGLPVIMDINEKLWINDVELGESIFYASMNLASGEKISVSELAFGFERLVFATEPGSSYYSTQLGGYDTIPIIKSRDQAAVCDTVKSTVLMAMNGLTPSNNNHGYQMRKFIKQAVSNQEGSGVDINEAAQNAHKYWKNFIISHSSRDRVIEILGAEFDRNNNRKTLDILSSQHGINIDVNINQSCDDFRRQIINTGRVALSLTDVLFR